MKLSVIIPTYNEEKYISECLKSLKDQTYKDFEIIVVDDGSVDNTVKIVKKFKSKLLTQKHNGPGAARNKAAKVAKGKILVFIDADMVASKNYLQDLTKPIIDNETKGTFTLNEKVYNFENHWARCWNYEYTKQNGNSRIPTNHPTTSNVFRAILKSEYDKVGGYDEVGYGEDWTISKKLGYKAESTQALIFHQNPSSLKEIFMQASWMATRPYKLGGVGRVIALVRASLPVSIFTSMIGIIRYNSTFYQIFKIVYDFGIFYGIIKYFLTGKYAQ